MIDDHAWLTALEAGLRRRGVPREPARRVLDEVKAHLWESGEDAAQAFGDAGAYAAAVAESLAGAATPRTAGRPPGPVRLRARGITKRYGGRKVLDSVDLTVRAGEVVAVVGANGCGKSTFLRVCAGLLAADSGDVEVGGSIGYCPQSHGTNDFLTADDHYVLVGAGRGLSRRRARREGRTLAGGLRWHQPAPEPAGRLSGGTRQKLNVVLTALSDPDILLLDEPYQGFDRGSYLDFWEHVHAWRDAGRAVVVVTHLMDRQDLADVVLDLSPRSGAEPASGRRPRKGLLR